MEKGRIFIGLSLTLISSQFSIDGVLRADLISIVLIGIITALGLLLLLKDKLPRRLGRYVEELSYAIDAGWIAFGLGLTGIGIKLWQIRNQPGFESLEWLAVILLILSAICIGSGIARGMRRSMRMIVDNNAIMGIVVGFICLVGGFIWLVLRWNTLITSSIVSKFTYVYIQIFLTFIGIIFIYFGLRKLLKSRIWYYPNEIDFDETIDLNNRSE